MKIPEKAIQDFYPDELSHCFGCGRLTKRIKVDNGPEFISRDLDCWAY